jgi:3-phosphoshikimate 1-carboxyvinyltransferase
MTEPRTMSPAAGLRLGRPYQHGGPLELVPHPDKAISQRATLLAAVAGGRSRVTNLADCRDTRSNLRALRQLGTTVHADGSDLLIDGVGPGEFDYRGEPLDAGNSATTARLLIAVLAGSRAECVVDGNTLLRNRPMGWVVDPLRQLGAEVSGLGAAGRLPVRVAGRHLRGGRLDVDVDSAQPVSALLFAGLAASDRIVIRRRTSARDHTERLLRWTGVDVTAERHRVELVPSQPRAFDLTVPGDPSAAAVLAALHLASPRSNAPLVLRDVCLNPTRMGFFHALRDLGGEVTWHEGAERAGPEPVGTITVRGPLELGGGEIGGRELVQAAVDEIPLLAALASTGQGELAIRDATELRDKDTDRIETTVRLLQSFGVAARATADGLVVRPTPPKAPATVHLPADHRLVFAGCVLALLAGGDLVLDGVDAAATSHPSLADDLAHYLPVARP